MAKDTKSPYWQICMTCDRRAFSVEPQQCSGCGDKMMDVLDHPDNAHRKSPTPPPKPRPAAATP